MEKEKTMLIKLTPETKKRLKVVSSITEKKQHEIVEETIKTMVDEFYKKHKLEGIDEHELN